jgi:hypothetical protein
VLSGLCGEILLEIGIGFYEVSYKGFEPLPLASTPQAGFRGSKVQSMIGFTCSEIILALEPVRKRHRGKKGGSG